MNVVSKVIRVVKSQGLAHSLGYTFSAVPSLADYYLNPFAMKRSKLPDADYEQVRAQMECAGLDVKRYHVDVATFRNWLDRAAFPKEYVALYGPVFVEKALEHYLSASLLDLRGDVFIDIAAASSPWYEIAQRLYGCTAYALDLSYPRGIHDRKIGADATNMPLADGFASRLALHCSYEMFEGNADIRLLSEAARVLASGGQMVILPLYMHHLYHYVESAPGADRRGLDYDGAIRVWSERPFGHRFSRRYSVDALMARVVGHLEGLSLRIYYVENEKEIDPSCYCKFVGMFQKPVSSLSVKEN